MTATSQPVFAAHQARRRAMVVPREHGAWGLLLVPLFTGLVAGFAPEHRIWPLLLFTVASLSLFMLRTPVESLLGVGSLSARTSEERWTAIIALTAFGVLAGVCLFGLMGKGQYSSLLVLGAVTALPVRLQLLTTSAGESSTGTLLYCGSRTGSLPATRFILCNCEFTLSVQQR